MQYKEFLRTEKLKGMLDIVAYASLVLDFAIAVVTLISINIYSPELDKIVYLLDIALSAEVVLAVVLFIILLLHAHYERLVGRLTRFGERLSRERQGRERREVRTRRR